MKFEAKSLWTRLTRHRGLVSGPLLARIRLGPKPEFPIDMPSGIRTDIRIGVSYLQTADCRLQTADCGLRTADCRLQTVDCRPQTAD